MYVWCSSLISSAVGISTFSTGIGSPTKRRSIFMDQSRILRILRSRTGPKYLGMVSPYRPVSTGFYTGFSVSFLVSYSESVLFLSLIKKPICWRKLKKKLLTSPNIQNRTKSSNTQLSCSKSMVPICNKAKRSAKQQRSHVLICFCLPASRGSDIPKRLPEK